ncbi:MAG: long-chain fatty acid--CoA ligase [Ignavibacteriae bacterium]|nr:long-chain fatty acid--CoA ligase [Ignavibacteria bacterium]MBI3365469.1 long-chain fatty acid--CoA ligase [Ignavibacteriota bacterium]
MGTIVEFGTIVEMFDKLTKKLVDEKRPVLMHKVRGEYHGISYRELRTMVEQIVCGLAALGVQRGARVALISENRPEWVVTDIAMMYLGAVNVSIYPTLTPKQIEHILLNADCSYAIVSNTLQLKKVLSILPQLPGLKKIVLLSENDAKPNLPVLTYAQVSEMGKRFLADHPDFVEKAKWQVNPDDLMTLIYTSGTTGNPKGVMLTHNNLVSNIRASAECIPFTETDRVLSFLPLCHSYERMAGYYTALACGATIAYAESIETVRDNLLEVKPTVVTTVPRFFERIHNRIIKQISDGPALQKAIFHWAVRAGKRYKRAQKNGAPHPFLLLQYRFADALVFKKIRRRTGGRIKFFASGGAALSRELGEFFEAAGIQVIEGYGMTESSPVISVNRLDDYKFGTVGKPISNVEVKIANDGEILVRGPNIMKGYWNDTQATLEAIDEEGWLHTGDIGTFDENDFLVITDRKKHLFVNSGGKNIAPQHIENLFLQSNLIDQFVLIGDGRMFLTAIIVPDFDVLNDVAKQIRVSSSSTKDLVENETIRQFFEKEIAGIQKDLASYERVRKFVLLDHPLTVEQGEITPTMKVKRKIVEERYRDLIEKMYQGIK